jgi:hypothetical protein
VKPDNEMDWLLAWFEAREAVRKLSEGLAYKPTTP